MRRVETPASRARDDATSHEAEAFINASGKRASWQAAALKAVQDHPGKTSMELASLTGMDRYQLARRLPELITGGTVSKGEARVCTVSQHRATTWWPVWG